MLWTNSRVGRVAVPTRATDLTTDTPANVPALVAATALVLSFVRPWRRVPPMMPILGDTLHEFAGYECRFGITRLVVVYRVCRIHRPKQDMPKGEVLEDVFPI